MLAPQLRSSCGNTMNKLNKRKLDIDDIWPLLDLFYKSGFTKRDMKFFIDTWWKIGDAFKTKYK